MDKDKIKTGVVGESSPEVDKQHAFLAEIQADIDRSVSVPSIDTETRNRIIAKAIVPDPIRDMEDDPSSVAPFEGDEDDEVAEWYFPEYIFEWLGKESGRANADTAEVFKLYLAASYSMINKIQREQGKDVAEDVATSMLFRFDEDPDPLLFIGGLANRLELLSIAGRGSVVRDYFYDHIEYGATSDSVLKTDEKDPMSEVLAGKDPIETISLINIEYRIAMLEMCHDSYSTSRGSEVSRALKGLADNQETPPLVRMIATSRYKEIDYLMNQTDNLELRELYVNEVIKGDDKYLAIADAGYARTQQKLHIAYPYFDTSEALQQIAPGVCASVSNNQFNEFIDTAGKKANVSDWQPGNDFGISEDDMFLLKVVHNKDTKLRVESEIGIKLEAIPLDSQIMFLRFAIEANNDRYNNLINQLLKYENESDKLEYINAFLALQFGDHFGDKLIGISERLDKGETLGILQNINEIRGSAKEIAKFFDGSTQEMAPAVETAWIKRITELLAVLSSDSLTDDEKNQAMDALKVLQYASDQIQAALDGEFKIDSVETGRTTYKSVDDVLTITARTSGSSSQRVGFKVSIPPELTPSVPDIVKKEKLSIRLDHDDTYKLALDIGSSRAGEAPADSSNISHFISDQMEKGELAITGQKVYGNHVREAFVGKIDDLIQSDDDFAKVVQAFVEKLKIAKPLTVVPNGEKHAA